MFSEDGTRLYVTGYTTTTGVYQYDLTTSWDISTALYSGDSIPTNGRSYKDIYISNDGYDVYVMSTVSSAFVYKYNLPVAWELSSYSLECSSETQMGGGNATAMYYVPQLQEMFIMNYYDDYIRSYNVCLEATTTTTTTIP